MELRQAAIASRDDPTTILVSGIDWAIRAGEFWVVAGLPSCGKSQLLEVVAGLAPPAKGEAVIGTGDDRQAAGIGSIPSWKQVGLVFADGGRPFNHLTVAQNLGLPLCYHGGGTLAAVAPKIQELLARVGLSAWGERLPSQLNRGLRQRIALGRALALEPTVLLLDNPLSGLGAGQARWWLEFLGELHRGAIAGGRAPAALAITTEDLRPWLAWGTDFALIEGGGWRVLGSRADVVGGADAAVRELLADAT